MAFAELREADAPPETLAVYAALRAASGVPVVNLIWRHLATMPGVLGWAWAATRTVLEDGTVAAARARLGATVRLPPLAVATAALDAADRAAVLAVVETYNRGNLTNLVLLTALRQEIEAAPRPPAGPVPAGLVPDGPPPGAEAPLPAIPPLPALASLPAETRALVQRLAQRHAGAAAGGVVPSLYLHLAHWPGLLQALPGLIGPVLDTLGPLREAAIAEAVRQAAPIRPRLACGAGVPGGHRAAVLEALTRFTTAVIPDMVPVGLALRRVLG
jgi:hypothetical protein